MAKESYTFNFVEDIDNIRLVDLLDFEELQLAQDAVSKMGRMATLITDENGTPVTTGSNFSRLCTDFCRSTPEGRRRCENCDRMGAISSMEQNKAVYYYCHANLVDFAAPIMLKGKLIGSFIGGQVLSHAPDLNAMRRTAREIGVDEDEFVEAAKETNIIPRSAIERCTNFVFEMAQMLSGMAYKAYVVKKESRLVLEAATAKTDFLANMSHEIRTPMNAIIGMSQIALREEMSKKARDYIIQVKSSADMLLTIINDILDYSKLEAGKMSIIDVNYSPLTLIGEVSNILLNRVASKGIEFIIDMDPSIPCELLGDDVRIKQILVNLANNAIKFTNKGEVLLSIKQKEIDSETIMLIGSVKDTGIGIKEENLDKLFNSFEQVDSKRNRKVEGTGLGLAIVKELVENMGGTISVSSVYEHGSTFTFKIPQKVVNHVRSVSLLEDCPAVLGVVDNVYIMEQLHKDMQVLGAQYMQVDQNMLQSMLAQTDVDFVFVEDSLLCEEIVRLKELHNKVKLVVVNSCKGTHQGKYSEYIQLERPISVIGVAAILQNKSTEVQKVTSTEPDFDFKAPEAHILVVDDNEVNLSVAAGLLEPLEMQIDLADSGMKAVEMASYNDYDIIFMDHMMPEMDGLETTQLLRSKYPKYKDVPVIALTANALSGNRDKFLEAGLNDFVPKPIELAVIVKALARHLPPDKIVKLDKEEILRNATKNIDTDNGISGMAFLDTGYALNLLKSEKLYWKVLRDYYNMIDKKLSKIKDCEDTEDIGNYIVEVHALKSSSKQIGALSLSKKAENLEAAGNRHDIDMIHNLTDEMLEEYRNLQTSLAPYFMESYNEESDITGGRTIDDDELNTILDEIRNIIDELDFDAAEEKMKELTCCHFENDEAQLVKSLKEAVISMDIDSGVDIIDKWKDVIKINKISPEL